MTHYRIDPSQVLRHISGSHVVVLMGPDEYLDARKDYRQDGTTTLEHVLGGQVRHSKRLYPDEAPATVVEWARRNFEYQHRVVAR